MSFFALLITLEFRCYLIALLLLGVDLHSYKFLPFPSFTVISFSGFCSWLFAFGISITNHPQSAEQATETLKSSIGLNAKQAEGSAKEMAGEAKGKAQEMAGEAKGKTQEMAGEAKGKTHEVAGQAQGKAEEVKGKM